MQLRSSGFWWTLPAAMFALLLLMSTMAGASEVTVRYALAHGPGSPIYEGLVEVAEAFMTENPAITVEIESGWDLERMTVATAGGAAPDLFQWWSGPILGAAGLLRPLDEYIRRDNVRAEDYAPAVWQANMWQGRIYSLMVEMSGGLPLLYNRAIFSETGLDPESPPTTLREFDSVFRQLTRMDGEGTITQMAMIPWSTLYNPYNLVQLWSSAFGGNPWDFGNQQPNFVSEPVVEALEWLVDYQHRYPLPEEFVGGLWSSPWNRLMDGREVMVVDVPGNIGETLKQYPDFDLGLSHPPFAPDRTDAIPSWLGGWRGGISVNSQHVEEAWQFLHFLAATEEGSTIYSRRSGEFPGFLPSPVFQEAVRDPFKRILVEIATGPTEGYALADSVHGPLAGEIMGSAVIDILTENVPVRSRLQQAQEEMLARMREGH